MHNNLLGISGHTMGSVCGIINILNRSEVKFVVFTKPLMQPNVTATQLFGVHCWHMQGLSGGATNQWHTS